MGSSHSAPPAHISSNGNPSRTSGTSRTYTQPISSQSRAHPTARHSTHPRTARMSQVVRPTRFSEHSDPGVADSLWAANDFMLGAGMVIIQPSTGKVVVLSDEETDARGRKHTRWFLPKGRKDIGESIEQTALREAYEEVRFRPLSCISLLYSTPFIQTPSILRRFETMVIGLWSSCSGLHHLPLNSPHRAELQDTNG